MKKTLLWSLTIGTVLGATYLVHNKHIDFKTHNTPNFSSQTQAEAVQKPQHADIINTAHSNEKNPITISPNCLCLYEFLSEIAQKSLKGSVWIKTQKINKNHMEEMPEGPALFHSPFDDLFKFFHKFKGPQKIKSEGSGFIIRGQDKKLLVITNNHVVSDADQIKIHFHDGSTATAKVKATDSETDIAILHFEEENEATKNAEPLEWGNSSQVKVGQRVLAIGNPFGLGNSVTDGIISSLGRNIPNEKNGRTGGVLVDMIQHTAQINIGNSGGALIGFEKEGNRLEGRIIGINTAIFSPSGGHVGVGFAINANRAKMVVEQLEKTGKVYYGWIGVALQELSDEQKEAYRIKNGIIVDFVNPNSPAEKAGLKPNDIITEYQNEKIESVSDLYGMVLKTPIGNEVTLKVTRSGKPLSIKVVLGKKHKEDIETKNNKSYGQSQEIQGIKIAEINEKICQDFNIKCPREGVIVLSVKNPKFREILKAGDIILGVHYTPIKSLDDLDKALKSAKNTKNVVITLERRGVIMRPVINLPKGN